MEALRLFEDPGTLLHRPALGIGCAVIEPRHPGMADRARAHRAGFQRDPQLAIVQPFAPQRLGRRANRGNLGMGGGVMILARGVVGSRDNIFPAHDYRAHRHFSRFDSEPGLCQGFLHWLGDWPACHAQRVARAGADGKKADPVCPLGPSAHNPEGIDNSPP